MVHKHKGTKGEPEVFKRYHELYAEMQKQWQDIPWTLAIKELVPLIRSAKDKFVVGDFGCGPEANIAKWMKKNFPAVEVCKELTVGLTTNR